MLPDIGASELLLIAVVALIVVGPKDLPLLMRKVGQFVARLRGMAAEFRASFDEMARQSELDELRKEVEAMRSGRILGDADTGGNDQVMSAISDIEQSLADTGAQFHPPMSHQITAPAAEAETPVPEAPAPETPAPETPAPETPAPSAEPKAKPKARSAAKPRAAAKPKTAAKTTSKTAPNTKAAPAKAPPAPRKPRAKKAEA